MFWDDVWFAIRCGSDVEMSRESEGDSRDVPWDSAVESLMASIGGNEARSILDA